MAKKTKDFIHILVHKTFFDKIFEPERKKLINGLGLKNISQTNFTEYLARSGAIIKYPKTNNQFGPHKAKMNNIFMPKGGRRHYLI